MTTPEGFFESAFNRRYVGGEGVIVEKPISILEKKKQNFVVTSYEDVLKRYRELLGDPTAELPEEVVKTLGAIERTENDGI